MRRIWVYGIVGLCLAVVQTSLAQVADSTARHLGTGRDSGHLAAVIDSAAHFDVMFIAEPGDTLVLMRDPQYQAFLERDSVPAITETEVYDTLDFRSYVPETPPDLIADRLSCLEQQIPLTYNRTVNSFINFFVVRKRNYTQTMLERMPHFFPIFEEALRRYSLPDELKYLAIVESGLNMRAVSKSSAVGLWQFMSATGRDFKLYQDTYQDDRMDPYKATEAACKYLRMLYNQFNDWELALAAYNCGPGSIRRTMARTGGRTFWEIYSALPQETRSYVPQFTAVIYAMHYAPYHNLYADMDSLFILPPADTVLLDKQVDFATLSHHLQIDPKQLLYLNPTIRRAVSPEQVPFALTLPAEAAIRFRAERQCFMENCAGLALADALPHGGKRLASQLRGHNQKGTHLQRTSHKVRRGETLFQVAQRYQVAVADVKHWNHLRTAKLRAGQRLIVYKARAEKGKNRTVAAPESLIATAPANTLEPQSTADSAQNTPTQAPTEGAALAKHAAADVEAAAEAAPTQPTPKQSKKAHASPAPPSIAAANKQTASGQNKGLQPAGRTHLVQPGDTLWNIARRYQGVTVQQLMRLNGLTDKNLKVGQKLIIG